MLRGEGRELVLEEHKAGHVLERLRFRVLLDAFLFHERLHAQHGVRTVTGVAEDLPRQRRVREIVGSLLNGCLAKPVLPYAELSKEQGLSGHYLGELRAKGEG